MNSKPSFVALVFACLAVLSACSAPPPQVPARLSAQDSLLGSYRMTGVRETAATLHLRPGGRFDFSLAYGGVDAAASGRWALVQERIELTTDEPPPPSLRRGRELDELASSYEDSGEEATLLVVKVVSSGRGMVWSNMEVTGEFSNGRKRTGITGRNGALGFLKRSDADWRGAALRRVTVAYPNGKVAPVTFELERATTRTLLVEFDPGALVRPAFPSMVLKVRRNPDGEVSLLMEREDGDPVVFER